MAVFCVQLSVFDVCWAVRIQNWLTNRPMCTVALLCMSVVRLCNWPCGTINVCTAISVQSALTCNTFNRYMFPSLILYSKIKLVHTELIFCDFFLEKGVFILYFMYTTPPLILLVMLFKITYVKEIGWSLLCGLCVCMCWGWGIETGWGVRIPRMRGRCSLGNGCDITSLSTPLASSRLGLVDDSRPETKMQTSHYKLPCV